MSAAKKLDGATEDDDQRMVKQVTLMDCFEQFRTPEMLDENNMWYCNKCKDHVRAQKQMEIYKAPPIFIISLKRFRQAGS